jgi:diadenosine tetraphosphate (Ap4A) HIT family hydrolase
MPGFMLDPQLAEDSIAVTDLPLSAVRLMKDANYSWLLLVPRRPQLCELLDLPRDDRRQLMDEVGSACEALRATVRLEKLNVATLGNVMVKRKPLPRRSPPA